MNNILHDEQTSQERANHIVKSLTDMSEVSSFEDFQKSHIQSEGIEVFDKDAVVSFLKSIDDTLSNEAHEDPEAAIAEATELIKSLSHQKVEMNDGSLKSFYFRNAEVAEEVAEVAEEVVAEEVAEEVASEEIAEEVTEEVAEEVVSEETEEVAEEVTEDASEEASEEVQED